MVPGAGNKKIIKTIGYKSLRQLSEPAREAIFPVSHTPVPPDCKTLLMNDGPRLNASYKNPKEAAIALNTRIGR